MIKNFTFGDRLCLARRSKKLTQGQLAEIVGTTKQTLVSYESAKSPKKNIDIQILIKLARQLEVTTDWLLTGEWSLFQFEEKPSKNVKSFEAPLSSISGNKPIPFKKIAS